MTDSNRMKMVKNILNKKLNSKFVVFETIEDDGTTTEEVVEVFELIDENEG